MAKNAVALAEPAFDIQVYTNVDKLAVIKDNLCGDSLSVQDFTKIKFPSGDLVHFAVPSIMGKPLMLECLIGVILQRKSVRAYWPGEYSGDNAPPQCSADDAMFGKGDPGGNCLGCGLAQWGSSTKDGSNAQACKMSNVNFIKIAESELPVMFRVPPSSINVMKKFMSQLPTHFSNCLVALELKTVSSKGGIKYPELMPRLIAPLTEDEVEAVSRYKTFFNTVFSLTNVKAVDAIDHE